MKVLKRTAAASGGADRLKHTRSVQLSLNINGLLM